jgi:hypothetical protein
MMDDEYLQLDMGQPVTINKVNIVWEAAYATEYQLQISDAAAGPFTKIYENKAGAVGSIDIVPPALTASAGRYLRVQGISRKLAAYGYSIIDMTVYGDADETCK